ncbi:MAG: amidohydrolase family protein [Candidatus Acidiferrum sp.]
MSQYSLARLLHLIGISLVALCLASGTARTKGRNSTLIIEHVTLIDSTGAGAKDDVTVLIEGERIKSIVVSGEMVAVPHAIRVDGKGKFLIAGLWDMHVHTLSKNQPDRFFPLFLANGVTGVRDMGGDLPLQQIQRLKEEIADGSRLGPEIFAAGPILEGEHPFWSFSIVVKNKAEARQAVATLVQEKADFVKVYNTLSREAYMATAASAKDNHIPFVGHIPPSVTPAEASDLGQRSIEHLWGIPLYCSAHPEQLNRMSAEADDAEDAKVARDLYYKVNQTILSSYDAKKAYTLFSKFAANQTWQTPTLTVIRSYAAIHDPALQKDARLAYMPDELVAFWKSMGGKPDPRNDAMQQRLFEHDVEIVQAMHSADVPMLAGTDTPNPYTYPGFSLPEELELLVVAGFSPMEVLELATRRAAEFLGVDRDLGSVERGKIANLLLLDANPLTEIGNTKKVRAVIIRGRLLDRTKLDELLASVTKRGSSN